MSIRVLIYACGTPAEILEQQDRCSRYITGLGGREIVSAATDEPGQVVGWTSACAMVCSGDVDCIVVASRSLVPGLDPIDSITREIQRLPIDPQRLPSPRHRRAQPLRRWAGGA